MILKQKNSLQDLQLFLSIVTILLVIGGLFIYSASSVYALEKFGSSHFFVKRHLIGLCLGLLALISACLLPVSLIKKLSPLLFISTTVLTALTLLPYFALRMHGSNRWLNIIGFTFQPSELLKIALIIYLAHFIEKKTYKVSSFLHNYMPLLFIIGIPSIILLKQPDFGMTVTLVITTLLLLFIAHFNIKHLLYSLSALVPIAVLLIVMRPYRLQRIMTFLNPWQDPQGAGFQIIQSLIAIGSGGFSGIGIGHSKQKFFYLPMQHTDFIFSIIAEETGFVGSLFVIMLFALFIYFGMRIAWQLKSLFATFTTLGFVILISLQAGINIAVTTGLAPTKGLGLPFVSYGSTSLVCNLFMVGIIINMVLETRN